MLYRVYACGLEYAIGLCNEVMDAKCRTKHPRSAFSRKVYQILDASIHSLRELQLKVADEPAKSV